MMPLYNAKQSQAIDHHLIHACATPSFLLMKRAAWHSWQTLNRLYPQTTELHILCGNGNNGGDGFMLAQYALLSGCSVTVYRLSDKPLKNDALKAWQEWQMLESTPIKSVFDFDILAAQHHSETVVVDALLGTGFQGELTPKLCAFIAQLNQAELNICALDCPTGLNVNTGNLQPNALKAQHTFSFLTQKFGFYTQAGPDVCGQIHYFDLGSHKALTHFSPQAYSHGFEYWQTHLPRRAAQFHKGNAGRALLIGGNHSMMGAIQLSASAALHSGCGFSQVITRSEHITALTSQQPELMCFDSQSLPSKVKQCDVIAIGTGLGQDAWAQALYQTVLEQTQWLVVDADALNLLAQQPRQRPNWILTPHPGEAARLLNCSTTQIQNDRIAAIKQLHQRYGGIVVLKGNGTLIYDGQILELCPLGNPGMASAGMGDVLTGLICGLLAQGMPPLAAACLGVYWHAATADSLYQQFGSAGVLPSRIIQNLAVLKG